MLLRPFNLKFLLFIAAATFDTPTGLIISYWNEKVTFDLAALSAQSDNQVRHDPSCNHRQEQRYCLKSDALVHLLLRVAYDRSIFVKLELYSPGLVLQYAQRRVATYQDEADEKLELLYLDRVAAIEDLKDNQGSEQGQTVGHVDNQLKFVNKQGRALG